MVEKGICPLFCFPYDIGNVWRKCAKKGEIYVLKVEKRVLCSWIVSPKPKNAMYIGSKIFKILPEINVISGKCVFFKRTLVFISISVCSSHGIVRLYLLRKLSLAIFSPKISYPRINPSTQTGRRKTRAKNEKKYKSAL